MHHYSTSARPLSVQVSPWQTYRATVGAGSLPVMDRPPTDVKKLLEFWMEWERGDATPGTLLKNLKNGGMKELLQEAAAVDSGASS